MKFARETGEVLGRYFTERFRLYTADSEFDACSRCDPKCCTDPLQVTVNAFDLIGLSLATGRKPSETEGYLSLGPDNGLFDIYSRQTGVHILSLELAKPCTFLDDEKCGIHEAKPIACATFPEINYIDKLRRGEKLDFPESYPCHIPSPRLSGKRQENLERLAEIGFGEKVVSGLYFFGRFPFLLNIAAYRPRLDAVAEDYRKDHGIHEDEFHCMMASKEGDPIRHALYNRVIDEESRKSGFQEKARRSIRRLDSRPLAEALVQMAELMTSAIKEGNFNFDAQYTFHEGNIIPSPLDIEGRTFSPQKIEEHP